MPSRNAKADCPLLQHPRATHKPTPTRQLVQLPQPSLDGLEVQQSHAVVPHRPDVRQVTPRVVQQVARGGQPHRLRVAMAMVVAAVVEVTAVGKGKNACMAC